MGHANLLTLQGDLFAPVGDRRFDLITANPPFVPAPSQDVGFRDGGPTGEDVQRRIVIGLPKHLAEGGIAQIVTQLGERRGESLERRFRTWLGGAPMDIQVLRLRTHSAEAYAIGYANGDSAAAVLGSVDRWSKNLADQGYYQVVSVLLAFSWSRDSWYREDEAEAPSRNAGDEVRAMFAAERLSRDESLRDRLRSARILRTGAVALTETQGLGAAVPPRVQARRLSVAMPVTHTLDLVERDILTSLADPRPASELLGVAARAGVAEDIVLRAMVSLVRKGLIRLND
jgi:hypothetical protein